MPPAKSRYGVPSAVKSVAPSPRSKASSARAKVGRSGLAADIAASFQAHKTKRPPRRRPLREHDFRYGGARVNVRLSQSTYARRLTFATTSRDELCGC